MTVLVGYVSRYGSTRSVAERLAARLAEQGHKAEALPLDEVSAIDSYEAAVVGSGIYSRHWDSRAQEFVRRHRAELAARPLWLFSVAMAAGIRGPLRPFVLSERPTEVAGFQRELAARDHHLFGGVMHREQSNLLGTLVLYAMGGRYGDFRDRADQDAWADRIAKELAQRSQPPPSAP